MHQTPFLQPTHCLQGMLAHCAEDPSYGYCNLMVNAVTWGSRRPVLRAAASRDDYAALYTTMSALSGECLQDVAQILGAGTELEEAGLKDGVAG